ncbi:MAG: response regulator [Bacteroidales bacterium]|nr:response regulator [Bacteroidales bacterium]
MNFLLAEKQKWFISLWISFISVISFSQVEIISLRQLSIDQGLPGVTVQDIYQDNKGIMWFGIESVGLCKYDGHNFKVYQNIPEDTTSISNNYASALCEDHEGFIWVGTRNGLNKFDRRNGRFTRYMHNGSNRNGISHNLIWDLKTDSKGNIWIASEGGVDMLNKSTGKFIQYLKLGEGEAQQNRVICLYVDQEDNIWVGTRNYGLYKITPQSGKDSIKASYKNWMHKENDSSTIGNNEIRNIIKADDGKLWIGTYIGLDRFDIKTGHFEHFSFKFKGKNEVNEFICSALCLDLKSNLWIGTTNNGILILNPATSAYKHLNFDPNQNRPLKSNSVRSVILDKSGLIWIGTKFAGIQIYDQRQETFPLIKEALKGENGLNESFVLSLFFEDDDILWIGTKGGGLNKYNRKTQTFEYYTEDRNNSYSISSNRIECISLDEIDNMWLATDNGLNYFNKATRHFTRYGNLHIRDLYYDTNGILWLGTADGLYVFNKEKKIIEYFKSKHAFFSDGTKFITRIYQDKSGILWFGTYQSGLYKYDLSIDELIQYVHNNEDTTTISGNMIRSIYEDRSGRIWVGTLSDGLNMLDRDINQFIRFKTTQGLGTNTIYSIVEDLTGNLWMGTHDGILKFDPKIQVFENYNIDYGLQGKVYEINAACISLDGEVFLGGSKGFNHFFPKNIKKPDFVGPMSISSVKIYDKIIAVDVTEYNEFQLCYDDNYILLDFSLLEYNDPFRNEYAYMLEGFDDDYIYSGNRHFTSYTSLPPGEYIFKVKGANSDKNWNNKGISIKLIIPKPYWKKWWFIILSILIGISIIVGIYILRITSIQKQQIILQEKVAQKTKDLREAYTILEKQKIEIETRNIELMQQSEQINLQNIELEEHRNRLEQLVRDRTKDLEEAKEKAEESDRLKSAFLANMSHEIRTPLNAIVGFADLLADGKLEQDEIDKYDAIVQNSSSTLLQLIDDIIDISKIEAGQLEINLNYIGLDAFLKNNVNVYKEMVNSQNKLTGCNIEFIFCPDSINNDIVLNLDSARLKQVLNNLISNAIKFTREGSIQLGYSISNYNKNIKIFVKDTGIGISRDNLKVIFDRFRKLETDLSEIHRGAGIGLAITKNLVEMMGGTISVESEINNGSVFYVEFPIIQNAEPTLTEPEFEQEKQVKRPNWGDKLILIVEDEESNFLLLETILFQTKAQTLWARNAEEALMKFEELKDEIDIALVDIELPGIKGTTLIEYLKKINKNIPVIAQTAYAMQNDEEKILKRGFDGYMAKPFISDDVYRMLSKYL